MISRDYFVTLWSKFFQKLHGTCVRNSKLNSTTDIGSECNIIDCEIGRCSYVGYRTCAINSKIGSFCSIGDNVYIGGAMHPLEWMSTSPAFMDIKHSYPKKRYAKLKWNPHSKKVVIGNDVWIGHGAVIQQGVNIGTGAVIGSNTVVTKDVPPYAIVGGVPAKVIRYRFDEKTIEALLESKWWELSDEDLKKLAVYIKSPQEFLKGCS